MKKLLYVSMCLPYPSASHAGGKTVYYYLNRFAHEKNVDLKLVCKVQDREKKFLQEIESIVDTHPICMPCNRFKKIGIYAISINSKINPFYKYGNTLTSYVYCRVLKELNQLKASGYEPDSIILEWTEMVLLLKEIHEIFPKAVIIASEHDVKYQSLQRKYTTEKKILKRFLKLAGYKNIKRRELNALASADLVVTQSEKDKKILINNGISEQKQLVISPYYMRANKTWIDGENCNIVIYGDMSREENYKSTIWFIENVFTLIKDEKIKLIVLGGNPPKQLKKFSCEKIKITGFVNDIFEYLDQAFCMVVPLQLGAGIKVKCLEALSYGIPLITNKIGIEGIGAIEDKDYLLCESPTEYQEAIMKLYHDNKYRESISRNALEFAKNSLDIEKSYFKYKEKLNV